MSESKTPKSDRQRELREASYAARLLGQKTTTVPKEERLDKANAILSNATLTESNKSGFDKTAYQRDYMRKKRQAEKTSA